MPIELKESFRMLDQEAFGAIAYEVMEQAFDIHNELGRFFDEGVYQQELVNRLQGRGVKEVGILVKYADFCKPYYLDLLVDDGAIFELKTVERLADEHRAQLLNSLLLTGSHHGKLINFRRERVEHDFVNTSLTYAHRVAFEVESSTWDDSVEGAPEVRRIVEGFLREWGTGLEQQLYVDALTHFFGGKERVEQEVDIVLEGRRLGRQKVRLAGANAAFKFTTLSGSLKKFESHAERFLKHIDLKYLLWFNIALHTVTMKVLKN